MLSKCSEKVVSAEQDTRHREDIYARFMAEVATYTDLPKKLHGTDSRSLISQKKTEVIRQVSANMIVCLRSTASLERMIHLQRPLQRFQLAERSRASEA